ncbi:hypothetical protein Tco_1456524 [Tanacetum coccineum]
MIRCRSEVEEAVRMISSAYSSHCRESERLRIVRMIAAFTILTLERVTIGCCEVGGGGGGVVGGVGVVCGELGVVSRRSAMGEVKAPISAMIVRVPEKDRWCGTRSKFMRWKGDVIVNGGGGEDIE